MKKKPAKKLSMRIIDQLRRLYPGVWIFDKSAPYLRWVGPEFSVKAVAQSAGEYEGKQRWYAMYVREDNKHQIVNVEDNNIYGTPELAVSGKRNR